MTPFEYPAAPHVRRHGPQGYASYTSYRPWLRDEFSYRCVYCLLREQWGRVAGMFDFDHFRPAARQAAGRASYANLLYSCATCNEMKGDAAIPDPCQILVQGAVEIRTDGFMEARTPESRRLCGYSVSTTGRQRSFGCSGSRLFPLRNARIRPSTSA
jgi:hypothetical protein